MTGLSRVGFFTGLGMAGVLIGFGKVKFFPGLGIAVALNGWVGLDCSLR